MNINEGNLNWDHLFDILDYNEKTGIFTNKVTRNSRAVEGTEAGNLNGNGYIDLAIEGIRYKAHRLAWFYTHAVWPKEELDHKDRVKHHNWISNLREATKIENSSNYQAKNTGASTYKGVYWDSGKWKAAITHNCKKIYLGRFLSEKEAAQAYNIKAKELKGEFAFLNKIE